MISMFRYVWLPYLILSMPRVCSTVPGTNFSKKKKKERDFGAKRSQKQSWGPCEKTPLKKTDTLDGLLIYQMICQIKLL